MNSIEQFWSYSADDLLGKLSSSREGISEASAKQRLLLNQQRKRFFKQWQRDILLLLSQYKNPLVLLLVFAAIFSLLLREYSDSSIIILILLLTGIFGFFQERNASRSVEELQALVRNTCSIRREGQDREIPFDEVVSGDILLLNAGDIISADSLILDVKDLHVNESILTGESFPVEKFAGICKADNSLSQVSNAVFKGTNVINGTATALAVYTGNQTELGKIAHSLQKNETPNAFEKGIRQFGYLIMKTTVVFALFILILNILFQKPIVDSLLFALALAVGMAPELLPAIVTITLSAGARRLASKKVIVKKLAAIQNLGEMNILCSDKTGTLTEGVVKVASTVDIQGQYNSKVREYAFVNAYYETGFYNPIDNAIRQLTDIPITKYTQKDEVPYDFIRKRLSVVVADNGKHLMITKGAVTNVLQCCNKVETTDGKTVPIDEAGAMIEKLFCGFSEQGFRTIGVSYKDVTSDPVINKDDETEMTFLGFVTFSDPAKEGIVNSLERLRKIGISLKLITGDNRLVAAHLAKQVGILRTEVLTGKDMHQLSTDALQRKVDEIDVFAEIEPAQKEQIIRALQWNKHVVGFLGDGINDANALKTADVGISVEGAVDIAKESADLVLLERDIDVISEGIIEGRKTFMNTLKYIFATTSANFGNMFSLAVASLFLPFLPLLPTQVLLNNFLSDLPALAIASDEIDAEFLQKPKRWNIKYVRKFMIIFGIESSIFDLLTFAMLLFVFKVTPEVFRTSWFIESLLTEILILLVIRTARPFLKSKPSRYLLIATLFTFVVSIILPFLPFARIFQLYPIPINLLLVIVLIVSMYVLVSEVTKKYIFSKLY